MFRRQCDDLLRARRNSPSEVAVPVRQLGCHDDLDARAHRRTQMQQLWPGLEPGIWHRDGTNRSELGTPARRRCCPVSSGTRRAKRSELRVYNVCSGRILGHLTKSLRCLRRALSGLPLATEFASAAFCGDSCRCVAQRQNQTFVHSAAKCSSALTTMRTLRTVACSCLTTDIGLRRITGMWPGSDCRGTRRVISCAASWRLMCETLAHNGTRLSWAAVRSNAAWRSGPSCSRSRS